MNTILSCIIGAAGGAFGLTLPALLLLPVLTPAERKPINEETTNNVISYSLACGAIIGLLLVLGSGQRL